MPIGLWTAVKGLAKNPKVLMGLSWGLAAGAVISAAVITPKAMRAYDDTIDGQFEKGGEDYVNSPRARAERICTVGKHYILSGVLLAGSMVSGGRSVQILTAGLNSSTNAVLCYKRLHEAYVRHNKELLGEAKEQEFRADAYRPTSMPEEPNAITYTGYGDTIFMTVWDEVWFASSIQAVDTGVLQTNNDMLTDHFMSLNELYMNWGLKHRPSGEHVGWWIDKDGLISVEKDPVLMDNGQIVILLSFGVDPESRYEDRDCR